MESAFSYHFHPLLFGELDDGFASPSDVPYANVYVLMQLELKLLFFFVLPVAVVVDRKEIQTIVKVSVYFVVTQM